MSSLRKFHSIAALRGDGMRPELQALFERLAMDPRSELFERRDGMMQSGPDPVSAPATVVPSAAGHRGVVEDSKPEPGYSNTLKKFADN
jgi:hypothetical protein